MNTRQNRPDVVTSASLAQRWRERAQRVSREPFAGQDRDGALPLNELADAEARAARSSTPKGKQWPELQRFDDRVVEFQGRQLQITAELGELRDKRAAAPSLMLDALAEWQLGDQRGPRPESNVEDIDRQIIDLQVDFDALTKATDRVLADKADYVEKHRPQLVQRADTAAQDACLHLVALLDEAEAARANLTDLRQSAVWASLFPAPEASQMPPTQQVHGGLARPIEAALGIAVAVQASRVFDLLRSDADWLRTSATIGQRNKMTGAATTANAAWADSDEGREFERAERQAKRDAYKALWGELPAEYSS